MPVGETVLSVQLEKIIPVPNRANRSARQCKCFMIEIGTVNAIITLFTPESYMDLIFDYWS